MSRERTYQTEAVVLRRRNWGEADRILTLFTPLRGKIRVRAVGVRKPASRKAGHLELFHRATLFLAKGRDFDIITQAETVEAYSPLREDLIGSAAASYAVELLDRLSPEESENAAAYRLLVRTLEQLSAGGDPALALRCYDLKLLEYSGYKPELSLCTVCGGEIRAEDQFFSPARGGAVCPRCADRAEGRFPVTLAALKVLRHIQRSELEEALQLPVGKSTLEELESILQRYIQYLLESPMRSRKFYSEVSRPRGEGGV
ncbi:MAG: DNA repair protein RecO [Anaerolineales bacterium]|nr:DNA repair protein RecO [Anaerolineales bacterium]